MPRGCGLSQREVTAQLAQKAYDNEVRKKSVKLEPEDLSETTLGLVTGSGTVNLETIPQNESVTPKKFSPSLNRELIYNLENLITNGDFSGDFNNWGVGSGTTLIGATGNVATIKGNGNQLYTNISQTVNLINGHKYYAKARYKLVGVLPTKVLLRVGSLIFKSETPSQLQDWDEISGIVTHTAYHNALNLRFEYANSTDALNSNVDIQHLILLDLTEIFGFGNEPTTIKMNEILTKFPNGWFDDVEGLNKVNYDLVEKEAFYDLLTDQYNNLYNGVALTDAFSDTGELINNDDESYKRTDYIKVKKGDVIRHNKLELSGRPSTNFFMFDEQKRFLKTVEVSTSELLVDHEGYVATNLSDPGIDYTSNFKMYNIVTRSLVNKVESINKEIVNYVKPSINNVIKVYDFNDLTKTDSQIIKDCLDFALSFDEKTIVFDQKDWHIDEAILLSENTVVIVDGVTIKQNNEVFDNIFRGDNLEIDPSNPYGYPLSVEEITNIKIIGINGSTLEGPDINIKMEHHVQGLQEAVGDFWGLPLFSYIPFKSEQF